MEALIRFLAERALFGNESEREEAILRLRDIALAQVAMLEALTETPTKEL